MGENLNGNNLGTAGKVAALCAGVPDLRAAWNALKAHEAEIAGFIDNKVTPKRETIALPTLEDMQRRGVEKNAIEDDNPVTVVFNDGSSLLLDAHEGIKSLRPPGTYPSVKKDGGQVIERIHSPLL